MALKQGYVAKIEEIKASSDKSTSCKMSTTSKGKVDFRGFVLLISNAHEKAVDISDGTEVLINDMYITTNASNGRYYTNIVITDLDIVGEATSEDEMDLPFR